MWERVRRSVIGVCVCVALIVSGLTALEVVSRAGAATVVVEPPVSKAPAAIVPDAPAGDFSNAPPTASRRFTQRPVLAKGVGFDGSRSVRDDTLTSASTEVFSNPDGTETARVAAGAVRFKGTDGVWYGYDLRLQPAASVPSGSASVAAPGDGAVVSGGDLVARASDVGVSISADPSTGLGRLATPAGVVTLGVPDVAGTLGAPVIDAGNPSVADYAASGAGLTVKMGLVTAGLEQSLVVGSPSGPSAYTVPITLPAGVTARNAAGGVEFVDGTGTLLARFGGGLAADRASRPATAPVGSSLVGQAGSVATLRVSVDAGWFADAARVFPVTIDPWLTTTVGSAETFVSSAAPDTPQDGLGRFDVGVSGSETDRGLVMFTGLPAWSSNIAVLSADVKAYNYSGVSAAAKTVTVQQMPFYWPNLVTWNNAPAPDTSLPATTATVPAGTGGAGGWTTFDARSFVARQLSTNVPGWGVAVRLDGNETDTASQKSFYDTEHANQTLDGTAPYLMITWKHVPNQVTPVSPVAGASVASVSPTLTVHVPSPASPDGDPVQYWFEIATGPDGNSGTIAYNSGWQTFTPDGSGNISLTVPPGYLEDGGLYYWNVAGFDGYIWNTANWSNALAVDLQLGAGRSPTDQAGPVHLNLATGNASLGVAGPSFPSVGGPLGVSFSYNSLASSSFGLTGNYFWNQSLAGNPVAVRRDETMRFDWGTQGPAPDIGATNWSARWTGDVTVPNPSQVGGVDSNPNWLFSVASDDGVRIWVNNTLVYDHWTDQAAGAFIDGSQFAMTPNTPTAIKIEYYNNTSPASLDVRLHPADAPSARWIPLGGNWLTSSLETPVLPTGWNSSVALAGFTGYTALRGTANGVGLVNPGGGLADYTWNGTAYVPDAGLFGHLTFDCDTSTCWWIYVDTSGFTEKFNPDGTAAWTRSGSDDLAPASAVYQWSAAGPSTPARLTQIQDPVSGRHIDLSYQGLGTCPSPPSGFDATPPSNMLCKIDYSSYVGGETDLFYQSGQLAEIQNPGDATVGHDTYLFAYKNAKLTGVMDPLAYDEAWKTLIPNTACVTDTPNTCQAYTLIGYDSSGRASSVTSPEPAPVASPNPNSRQAHSYLYDSANLTRVQGLFDGTPPVARTIETAVFDGQLRQLWTTDATGHTASQAWDDPTDTVKITTDPAGITNTTVLDEQGRPLVKLGPAPANCFTGVYATSPVPPGCPASMPADWTIYDGGLNGLAAQWANDTNLQTAPVSHTTWTGIGGTANQDWGTSSPAPGVVNTDNFSGMLSGEIQFPTDGIGANRWTLKAIADDGVKVYVDGALVIDKWGGTYDPSGATGMLPFDVTANSKHSIFVMFQEGSGNASLALQWQPAGGTMVAIPIANLFADYSLVTSRLDADGHQVDTSYTGTGAQAAIGPQYGLPVSSTVDPAGLALTTTDTYELPSTTTYFRHLTHVLPKGSATTVTDAHYGATETRTFPSVTGCPTGTNVLQGGLPKKTTGATPGTGVAPTREAIYNAQGLTAFTQQAGDGTKWFCNAYDTRLRLTKMIDTASKAITPDYTTPGTARTTFVDSAGTSRTTTTKLDLLGRTTSYTDELGSFTEIIYNLAGRVTDTYRTLPGQTRKHVASATYDDDGRPLTSTEYVSLTGGRTTAYTYDTAGRPSNMARPTTGANPVNTTTAYDAQSGRVGHLTDALGSAALADDGYTYTPAGRISGWGSNRNGAASLLLAYTYDQAGRLTTAGGSWTHNYSFDANTNRCATAIVTNCAGATYTYDNADRLTASPAGSGYTYNAHGNLTQYTTAGGQTITLTYDAYDHAKTISTKTGTTTNQTVTETLSPSGRVIRRNVTGTNPENTSMGYSGDGDSPAYSYPYNTPSGTVTSYLGTAIVTGTTLSYLVTNLHGDIVGTTDAAGTFTAAPVTDENGVTTGTIPAGRLGWLGAQERFTTAQGLGLIRMGVRLYDPALGRFDGRDPVQGASANSYDYASADPINSTDLDGQQPSVLYQGPGIGYNKFGIEVWVNGVVYCGDSYCAYKLTKLSVFTIAIALALATAVGQLSTVVGEIAGRICADGWAGWVAYLTARLPCNSFFRYLISGSVPFFYWGKATSSCVAFGYWPSRGWGIWSNAANNCYAY